MPNNLIISTPQLFALRSINILTLDTIYKVLSTYINEMYYELVPSPDAILFFVIFNNPV